MRNYSIKELENYSGIKAHTIRIWEQRYNLLNPSRTDTGYRYYNDDDLKKLLSISVLQKAGVKISKVASLSKEEIKVKLKTIESQIQVDDSKIELSITNLLTAGLEFDQTKISEEYEIIKKSFSTFDFMVKIIYPLLERIGLMWEKDDMTPIQEHFISNFIRQKLIVEIDLLPVSEKENYDFVLVLPETETHEIGLLFTDYMLRAEGYKTLYLGQLVPVNNIIGLLNEHPIPKVIAFMLMYPGTEKFKKMVYQLANNCSKSQFYWSGSSYLFSKIDLPSNFTSISSIEEFRRIILNK